MIINPGDDFAAKLQVAIDTGQPDVYVRGGEYTITRSIFVDAERLHIHGIDNPTLVHDVKLSGVQSSQPIFFVVSPDFVCEGISIDWRRTEWLEFSKLFDLTVPQWVANRWGYTGPLDVEHSHCEISGCHVYDSLEREHGPGGDYWVVTPNGIGGTNLILDGNRVSAPDTELTGGTASRVNVMIRNNHIQGGRSGGGLISMLSRSDGYVRNLQVVDNVIYDLRNLGITLGFDSDSESVLKFDNVLVRNNTMMLGRDPNTFVRFLTLKFREFTGTLVCRENLIDCTAVEAIGVKGRTIAANNTPGPSGTLLLWEPTIIPKSGVGMGPAIKTDKFQTVTTYL